MMIQNYQTIVFDCDGVILDSNRVKTEAFYKAALPYGELAAEQLVAYHTANGGVSRYKKFEYFVTHIVAEPLPKFGAEALITAYARYVVDGLLTCNIAEGLTQLKQSTPEARWLVASGGDQQELRQIFAQRGLDLLFDGGIFGSPDSKETILRRELEQDNVRTPALFIGDSRYDHIAASAYDLDFVFLSQWTEFDGWETYCHENNILHARSISELY